MSFKVKHYELTTDKFICADKISMVFLSDLHLAEFGNQNQKLIDKVIELNPDFVISGGDMIIGDEGYATDVAENLLSILAQKVPVYAGLGNHEKRFKERREVFGEAYEVYMRQLESAGVKILDNQHLEIEVNGERIHIYGLSLPLKHYRRFSRHTLPLEEMVGCVGAADKHRFNLLLAHHPRFAETYFDWGADLTLSGHIHGGVMRFGKKVLISPDFQLFPKYGYGRFTKGHQNLLICAGLGEHTVPFRIFNPKEILYIEIKQEVSHGDSR